MKSERKNLKTGIIAVSVREKIYTVRDMQVMLDSDLAELYGIETKMLNRAVKRNSARFPENFMFQLNNDEWNNLRFQSGTSKETNISLKIE